MKKITTIEAMGTKVKRYITALNGFNCEGVKSEEVNLWATITLEENGHASASISVYEDRTMPSAPNSIHLCRLTSAKHYTREERNQTAEAVVKDLEAAIKTFEKGEAVFNMWRVFRDSLLLEAVTD